MDRSVRLFRGSGGIKGIVKGEMTVVG